MADEPKRYMIKTVADFLQVPEERQEQCLKEFAIFLHSARFMVMLGEDLSETNPSAVKVDGYEWVDDGELNVRIKLTPVDSQELSAG